MIAGRGGMVGDWVGWGDRDEEQMKMLLEFRLDRRRGGVRVTVLRTLRQDAGQQEAVQVVTVNSGVEEEPL